MVPVYVPVVRPAVVKLKVHAVFANPKPNVGAAAATLAPVGSIRVTLPGPPTTVGAMIGDPTDAPFASQPRNETGMLDVVALENVGRGGLGASGAKAARPTPVLQAAV